MKTGWSLSPKSSERTTPQSRGPTPGELPASRPLPSEPQLPFPWGRRHWRRWWADAPPALRDTGWSEKSDIEKKKNQTWRKTEHVHSQPSSCVQQIWWALCSLNSLSLKFFRSLSSLSSTLRMSPSHWFKEHQPSALSRKAWKHSFHLNTPKFKHLRTGREIAKEQLY